MRVEETGSACCIELKKIIDPALTFMITHESEVPGFSACIEQS